MKRSLLALLIILAMIIVFPTYTLAENHDQELGLTYLNVGDSIAFGLSAEPGHSYFDLYSGYLEDGKFGFSSSMNLGMPGLDSMELLKALNGGFGMTDPQHYALQVQLLTMVPQADVITISIGGNNLLTPVIASTFSMYGLNPLSDPMQKLMSEIINEGQDSWNMRLGQFTFSALSSAPGTLGYALEMRTAQFIKDWPAILDRLEELNPDAHIIAMTLYNPVDKMDNEALHNRYEELVKPMRKAMMRTQNRAKLVDTAKAFRKNPDAVAFKLTWTAEMPPVIVDPHPTTFGHLIIFEELMNARNPRSFR